MMPVSLGGPAIGNATLVLDSWPVMERLKRREPATGKFREILSDAEMGDVALVLSSIDLGEIYYNCWNEWDRSRADSAYEGLLDLPIHIIHPTSADAMAAAKVKAEFKVSYADAFAAILAVEFGTPVLTGDPDFLKLLRNGVLAFDWIGA